MVRGSGLEPLSTEDSPTVGKASFHGCDPGWGRVFFTGLRVEDSRCLFVWQGVQEASGWQGDVPGPTPPAGDPGLL